MQASRQAAIQLGRVPILLSSSYRCGGCVTQAAPAVCSLLFPSSTMVYERVTESTVKRFVCLYLLRGVLSRFPRLSCPLSGAANRSWRLYPARSCLSVAALQTTKQGTSATAPPMLAPHRTMDAPPSSKTKVPPPQRCPQPDPSLPDDAIALIMRHGAVSSVTGDFTIIDHINKVAAVNIKASDAGALVLGLANSNGTEVSITDFNLGQLRYSRLLACARNKLWWMTPEWRSGSSGSIPPETQFLLLEASEGCGPYALLLPLIDGNFRATLRAISSADCPAQGEVCLRLESGDRTVTGSRWDSVLYIAAGWDPYTLIERGVAAAAALSGGARARTDKVVPPLLDNFGWCTWDAFYSTVSAKGLQEGIQSLHDGNIRPGFLIIDDGWQMTDTDPPMLPTPAELAARMKMEQAKELLESTESDFYKESQTVLGQAAERMPPGSTAGQLLRPTAEKKGPAMPHHHHHHHGGSSASVSLDSASASQDAAGSANSRPEETGGGGKAEAGFNGRPKAVGKAAAGNIAALSSRESAEAAPPISKPAASAAAAAMSEPPNKEAIWLVRVAQKAAGALIGLGSAAFVVFYQWVVEPAAPGSLPVRLFASAAKGPLRGALLSFFAASSDFTRRLTSVKANGKFSSPDAGPDADWEDREEQLGVVVSALKAKYGIKQVYCWHGLPAYWAGVMPDAPAVAKYNARIVYADPTPGVLEVEPAMAWNPAVLAGIGVVDDPAAVYNDMHRYLAASNIDGVKVDCQAGVGLIGSQLGGGPALSRKFQAALEASVAEHFADNNCINCMCHSTENLYRMTGTSVVRASDDFYPRDPSSSAPHIAACAYNSVFLSALLLPDWDMFQSKHPAASLHAMARAISGGAVYVSDKPGEHDYKLLSALVLPDGSVLRAQLPGRPTRDCLFTDVMRDNKTVLKVWNTNRHGAVVGLFHLQGSSWDRSKRKFYVHDKAPRALTAYVSPRDIEPWRRDHEVGSPKGVPAQRFVGYSFISGELRKLDYEDAFPVTLTSATSDMVTLAPVSEVGKVAFAPIGLINMINSGGAITSCSLATGHQLTKVPGSTSNGSTASDERPAFMVAIRGCGQLLLYASQKPQRVLLSGAELSSSYDAASGKLLLDVPAEEGLSSELQVMF